MGGVAARQPEHRLLAAFPGFSDRDLAAVPAASDPDDALARPGLTRSLWGGRSSNAANT